MFGECVESRVSKRVTMTVSQLTWWPSWGSGSEVRIVILRTRMAICNVEAGRSAVAKFTYLNSESDSLKVMSEPVSRLQRSGFAK
ncbi:hypothetical protein [Paenibacillus gorillae]|uniref:hypothetical protein n=1 Tax=Paenibacillus gorillae TaxID=1243662 RepID=UPI0005AAB423|nr:hypothetical protein [Paenibacillus gorillae]